MRKNSALTQCDTRPELLEGPKVLGSPTLKLSNVRSRARPFATAKDQGVATVNTGGVIAICDRSRNRLLFLQCAARFSQFFFSASAVKKRYYYLAGYKHKELILTGI